MDNRCVCCGEIIPEGLQVCYNCFAKTFNFDKDVPRGEPSAAPFKDYCERECIYRKMIRAIAKQL